MNQNGILKLCMVVLLLCSSAGFALESGEKALPFVNLEGDRKKVRRHQLHSHRRILM